jgi:hypothetical protein
MELTDYLVVDTTSPTGLRWIKNRRRVKAGTVAFTCVDRTGYYVGVFNGKKYGAHQVVFFLTHGYWAAQVDHIDGNRLNNTPCNIREVSHSENQHNRISKGYYYCNTSQRYIAQICTGRRKRTIGRYTSAEEAHQAYLVAKAGEHPTAPTRCY